jgi:hypothetical protein
MVARHHRVVEEDVVVILADRQPVATGTALTTIWRSDGTSVGLAGSRV